MQLNTGKKAPCIAIIKDVVGNVKKVEEKLGAVLKTHDMYTRYIGSRREARRLLDDGIHLKCFLEGGLVLIAPANKDPLRCLACILELTNADNVMLLADECDALWTRKMDEEDVPSRRWQDLTATKPKLTTEREAELYRLLGLAPLSREPGVHCSRVRSFVQVSATHITTLAWLSMWDLGFYGASMDLSHMRERGYALYDDLKPMQARSDCCRRAAAAAALRCAAAARPLHFCCIRH